MVATAMTTLRTIETDELSAKRPTELSAPDISATSDMHKRYGIVIRVSSTARSNFSGSASKPGASANIKNGIASSAMIVRISRTKSRPAIASSANVRADSLPSPSNFFAKIGTNAELNAPSPNRRRNRFGNRKATTNASATQPVPSEAAIRISRTKPKIRLSSVNPPTVAKAL